MPNLLLFDSIFDATPETLKKLGIRLLLLDLDNTAAAYSEREPSNMLIDWAEALRLAGITLFIVSNNRGERPAVFAAKLKIGYVRAAKKPSGKAPRELMRGLGLAPAETAIVGDQFFTDALAGAFSGIRVILVRPVSLKNPLLAIRYALELPFRIIAGRRL